MSFRIEQVDFQPLRAPLRRPFVIASGRVDSLENVAVSVRLSEGVTGWGEIPVLPGVTAENAANIAEQIPRARDMLGGFQAAQWRDVSARLALRFGAWPGFRAGIEMAVIDALARRDGEPLYRWLQGAEQRLRTDMTIPICEPAEAGELAAGYMLQGFETLKLKVGLDASADLARLRAVAEAAPAAGLVLDGNCGMDVAGAMDLLAALARHDIRPVLLEQPLAADDWQGMRYLHEQASAPVAADESCRTVADARRLADERACAVINIKLVKSGLAEALDIIAVAKAAGLGLMIGGMVETRIAMGFSAHLAAGIGGFDFVDLDTPLLLATDPVRGGYRMEGADIVLAGAGAGHGGEPAPSGMS